MNREIKFRAWSKINKKMTESFDLVEYSMATDNEMGDISLPYNFDEDGELMQFTGLHDKNNKEIYEGDIVRDIGGFNVEVRWENGREGYVPFSIGRGERNPSDCEVIGNIYENYNILNKEK